MKIEHVETPAELARCYVLLREQRSSWSQRRMKLLHIKLSPDLALPHALQTIDRLF